MQNPVKKYFIRTAFIVNAQSLSGNVYISNNASWWICASNPTSSFTFLVTTSNQALPLTSNFGFQTPFFAYPYNPPCTSGVLSKALSWADLRIFLDPNQVNYTTTLRYMSCNDCVQVCDQTKPATPPPLNTWCLLVSNPAINSVYVSVKVQFSASDTSTPTSSATSSSTSSTSASASASAITTVVVMVPTSSASKMSEQSSLILFFGLVWLFGSLISYR